MGARAVDWYRRQGWQVVACGHGVLDITDAAAVKALLARERPQAVLHGAAVSDTGTAQKQPERSWAINVQGTQNVAAACAASGAKLVYLSSDQVYGGNSETTPLPENAPLTPKNVYGQHKLLAEQRAAQLCPDAVGLRLTWMYDLPDSPYRPNRGLLCSLRAANETGAPLNGAVREQRGITNVWDVVTRLPQAFALPGGVYNFGCENRQNSYETLCTAAALCGYPPEKLVRRDETFCRNLAMDTAKARAFGIDFPDTVEGLRRALALA